jgi:hypothetical protein
VREEARDDLKELQGKAVARRRGTLQAAGALSAQ